MSTSRKSILLVEDNLGHAELVQHAFKRDSSCYVLDHVTTIAQACRRLDEYHPDLVLLDFRLPDGDGDQLIEERLRGSEPNQLILPVVVMTGFGNEQQAVRMIKTGALDYVVKTAEILIDMPHIVTRSLAEWSRIQELAAANAKITRMESEFSRILSEVPDIVYKLDSEGVITFINTAIRRLGYDEQALLGTSIFDLVHDDDRERARWRVNERRTGERRTQLFELRLRHADGANTPYEFNTTEISLNAEGLYGHNASGDQVFLGTHGVARDISERKKNETKIHQFTSKVRKHINQELLDEGPPPGVDRISDFAAAILHDIDTVLNSAITSSQTVARFSDSEALKNFDRANGILRQNLERLPDFFRHDPKSKLLTEYYFLVEDQLRDDRRRIRDNADDLIRKIKTIQNVITAHLNYVVYDHAFEVLAPEIMVDDALLISESAIQNDEIIIVKSFEDVPPISVHKTKVMHILLNLISNARRAITRRNHPDHREIHIQIKRRQDTVQIGIRDTGTGIAPDRLCAIFEAERGTGQDRARAFNLRDCAEAMIEMGGRLEAESDGLNRGAAFTLVFQ